MRHDKYLTALPGPLIAAAAVWPTVITLWGQLSATPLQRALRASWCGVGPHDVEMFGHCSACWSGVAAFLIAAAIAATFAPSAGHRERIRGITAKAIRVRR